MKQFPTYLLVLLVWLPFIGCEDVVEIDTPTEEPRLVVDALIRIDTTLSSTNVRVKLTQTASFFGTIIPAQVDQITLSNLDNPGGDNQVLLEETPGSGIYSKPFPTDQLIRDRWLLQIDYEGELFVAESVFIPSVPIDNLEQGTGFLGDEAETEMIITYTDDPTRDDFYVIDFDLTNYVTTRDEFNQGQQFTFSFFYDEEEVAPGDELNISILGADERFFDYMRQILDQSEADGGPFATPALTVRGNIINATEIDNDETTNNVNDTDNFALGYFILSQAFTESIVIEDLSGSE